jgi:hypothetical protein
LFDVSFLCVVEAIAVQVEDLLIAGIRLALALGRELRPVRESSEGFFLFMAAPEPWKTNTESLGEAIQTKRRRQWDVAVEI